MSKAEQPQSKNAAAWEGLGGPIRMDRLNPQRAWLDPTLDTCCARDMEERAVYGALQRTLRRFDVTAERERRRRNAVALAHGVGCRCLYDPAVDGGTYEALETLQATLAQETTIHDNNGDEQDEIKKKERDENDSVKQNNPKVDEENDDDNDDDEFDYLLDEDLPGQASDAVQSWKETRRIEMETLVLKQEVEDYHGYGQLRQFHPRRIAAVVGLGRNTTHNSISLPPPFVVWHLYDSESKASAWLDVYLQEFAAQARGTLFLRSHGRGSLLEPSVAEALQADLRPQTDMPALVLVQNGVVVTACPRLRDFCVLNPEDDNSQPHIDRAALEAWLFQSGALDRQRPPPAYESLCRLRPEEEALMNSMLGASMPEAKEETYYDCGLPGCCKTFPHEHVGITTDQQDGLVVPADKVLEQEL